MEKKALESADRFSLINFKNANLYMGYVPFIGLKYPYMGESKCLPQIMDRINVLLLIVEVLLPRQNLLTLANLKVFNSFRFLSAAAIDIHTPLCYNNCNTRDLLGRKFNYQQNHFIIQ